MDKIPPMPPAEAAAAERAYPGILDQLPGVVAEAQVAADRRGERCAFARIAWALSNSDPADAARIGAAAIVQLAGARR